MINNFLKKKNKRQLFLSSNRRGYGIEKTVVKFGDTVVAEDGTGDTDSLMEAINILSADGGVIFVKDGSYNIDKTLNITKANTTIKGVQEGAVLNILNTNGIEVSANNTTLENLEIKALATTGAAQLINIGNVSDTKIRSCYLNCSASNAVLGINESATNATRRTRIEKNKFLNARIDTSGRVEEWIIENDFSNNLQSSTMISASGATGIIISKNSLRAIDTGLQTAIDVNLKLDASSFRGLTAVISDNFITDFLTNGIKFVGIGSAITNNSLYGVGCRIASGAINNFFAGNYSQTNHVIEANANDNIAIGNSAISDSGTNNIIFTDAAYLSRYMKKTADSNLTMGANSIIFNYASQNIRPRPGSTADIEINSFGDFDAVIFPQGPWATKFVLQTSINYDNPHWQITEAQASGLKIEHVMAGAPTQKFLLSSGAIATTGSLILDSVPTSPGASGAIYNDAGTLKITL